MVTSELEFSINWHWKHKSCRVPRAHKLLRESLPCHQHKMYSSMRGFQGTPTNQQNTDSKLGFCQKRPGVTKDRKCHGKLMPVSGLVFRRKPPFMMYIESIFMPFDNFQHEGEGFIRIFFLQRRGYTRGVDIRDFKVLQTKSYL